MTSRQLLSPLSELPVRERIGVHGQVQGVGFRPFVHRLATGLGLSGWVRNGPQGVELEVQGPGDRIETLLERLHRERPPLARIDRLERRPLAATDAETADGFAILDSADGPVGTAVAPDACVCGHCLTELFDPADRRYRYPFVNCTHCGPRYTITRRLPYDRATTSMAGFRQCPRCQAEYDNPGDRRFHAQPNACPDCGPRLAWCRDDGLEAPVGDVVAHAVARLQAGAILAIKGLGGFHLACDARNPEVVMRLRRRKGRDEKPFAVMAAGLASLGAVAHIGEAQRRWLESVQRPVVLLPKRAEADAALAGCAPGIAWLGAMLPYTPLHYLLFHEAAGRPVGRAWLERPQELLLVMTSANAGGEPLVTHNDEARERLAGIADGFVLHDRPIAVRCDDSVLRVQQGAPAFIRRGRGFTPEAIRLPRAGPATLAVGGWFKNTVCLTRGDEAFVSQHVGELDSAGNRRYLEEVVTHLTEVLQVRPERVAHDLHPDYHSTRFGAEYAARHGLPTVAVQHHHAHLAAVAAEHRLDGALLGLALDGVGLGDDGGAWGGELLHLEGGDFRRLGHLEPLALPGGDRAAREPWRMAAAALHALGRGEEIARRFPGAAAAAVGEMLARDINCPRTSSMGRWFDAATGLLGVRRVMAFEGQAAMLLEGLASRHGPVAPLRDGYRIGADGRLDLLPLAAELAQWHERSHDVAEGAALFHATLVEALAAWVERQVQEQGVSRVLLGGGCFVNHILTEGVVRRLAERGIEAFTASRLPPNDGGLSLGQAWVGVEGATSDAADAPPGFRPMGMTVQH